MTNACLTVLTSEVDIKDYPESFLEFLLFHLTEYLQDLPATTYEDMLTHVISNVSKYFSSSTKLKQSLCNLVLKTCLTNHDPPSSKLLPKSKKYLEMIVNADE